MPGWQSQEGSVLSLIQPRFCFLSASCWLFLILDFCFSAVRAVYVKKRGCPQSTLNNGEPQTHQVTETSARTGQPSSPQPTAPVAPHINRQVGSSHNLSHPLGDAAATQTPRPRAPTGEATLRNTAAHPSSPQRGLSPSSEGSGPSWPTLGGRQASEQLHHFPRSRAGASRATGRV